MPYRAITLDNQLVVLATTATDAGRYHVEAVNEMTGDNVTSPAVYLSISGKEIKYMWTGDNRLHEPSTLLNNVWKNSSLFSLHKLISTLYFILCVASKELDWVLWSHRA